MKKFSCPSCGADVVFVSDLSVYAVCQYCRSMVVRHDVDVEAIGTMAELPQDMSPFQIGTEGIWKGTHFTLVGRLKIGWADGTWNEWFMASDDGRRGWLAEAQGFYAVSYETAPPDLAFARRAMDHLGKGSKKTLFIGSTLKLDDRYYKVVDVKMATCIGSEGELPFAAPRGRKTVSVDLVAANGGFACVEIETGSIRAYTGRYAEWKELKVSHERKFDDW
jgi:hypothetical protein